MKHFNLSILALLIFAAVGHAQSIDERIGNAMNNGQWRELRDLYLSEGEQLQTPFLHPLSRFFICHFYNEPDSALYYGMTLLKDYQNELGSSVGNVMYYMAEDCSRLGKYREAADILHQFNDAVMQAGQDAPPLFIAFEKQLQVLADCGGFSFHKPDYDVKIPVRYFSRNRKEPVMIFISGELNGKNCDITYDTGAGVNIITPELANEINARITDFEGIDVKGVNTVNSRFAVVDSIKLGGIIYRNVPFQVIDLTTGHVEADKKLGELNMNCILGIKTMLPLEEIRFDFAEGNLIIPSEKTEKPDFAPNFYIAESNNIHLSVFDCNSKQTIDANLDTGASFTALTAKYYNENKPLFTSMVPTDSVRMAGAGGVHVSKHFTMNWSYEVGGTKVTDDSVSVEADTEATTPYHCLFGLPSLTRHDLVIINFKDMWVKLSPAIKL